MIPTLLQRVSQQPNQTALKINGQTLSYKSLWEQAKLNAEQLKQMRLPQNSIIALHGEKSNDWVVMQLACWMANLAFLPMPASWPKARILQALSATNCAAVFSNTRLDPSVNLTLPRIQYLTNNEASVNPINNTVTSAPTTNALSMGLSESANPSDPAYVIFSSGSTGHPKGIMISFTGLPQMIAAQIEMVQLKPGQRTLWLHDIEFDASIADIWVTLLAGATLYAEPHLAPTEIIPYLGLHEINYVDLPAPLISLLSENPLPPCLETVLVGGDRCELTALRNWCEHIAVIIAYGPSEVTICSSMYHFLGTEEIVGLIGSPLPHLTYWVVDEHDEICPPHQPGELIIGGKGIALGYCKNNDRKNTYFGETTKDRFCEFRGLPAYRTGDRVCELDEGYQFLGRLDRQFKYRGKLICPEEIENLLVRNPVVRDAFVFMVKDHLVVALSATNENNSIKDKGNTTYVINALKNQLAKQLPGWMIPTKWFIQPALPKNSNHKIDPAAIMMRFRESGVVHHAKADSILNTLEGLLDCNQLSYDDCLLDYYFDSLTALRIVAALEGLGYRRSVKEIFTRQSIQELLDLPEFSDQVTQLHTQTLNSKNKKGKTQGYKKQPEQNSATKTVINPFAVHSDALSVQLTKYPPLDIPAFTTATQSTVARTTDENTTTQEGVPLLTGVTGKLGQQLFQYLAQDARTLYCLVRNTNLSPAIKRYTRTYSNIHFIKGDLQKPKLGLTAGQWNALTMNVTDIYHCAADTSLLKTVDELEATNVRGTYHLLQLMAQGQPKRIHYASLGSRYLLWWLYTK